MRVIICFSLFFISLLCLVHVGKSFELADIFLSFQRRETSGELSKEPWPLPAKQLGLFSVDPSAPTQKMKRPHYCPEDTFFFYPSSSSSSSSSASVSAAFGFDSNGGMPPAAFGGKGVGAGVGVGVTLLQRRPLRLQLKPPPLRETLLLSS
jgi:hypothetical protein